MKRILSLILAVIFFMGVNIPTYAAMPETITPLWANTSQAQVTFVIRDNGEASWTIICDGKSSCTGIDAITYIERKIGTFWVKIDLGVPNNEYRYSTTNSYLVQNHETTITSPGTYRAVVIFTVYGTVEDEAFTLRNEHGYGLP